MDETAVLSEESDADDAASDDDERATVDEPRPGAPDSDGGDEDGDDALEPWQRRLALASVLLPFAVVAVALVVVARDHLSVADHAGIEAHVRHVGRREVLLGLWSRDRWNHPGPLFFYLAAPVYWLTGGLTIGVELTATAVNAAAIAGMALLARRRGGTPLLLCTLLGCAVVMRSFGTEFLHDPWNTYIPTLPYGVLLLLVWSALCADRWALPLAVLVASFVAQTHIGFVLLAVPLVAVAAGWILVRAVREPGRPRRDAGRSLAVSAGIAAVAWLPPLLDVLLHEGSNARRVMDYFTDPGEDTRTLAEGWRVMLGQFLLPPEWLSGRRPPLWPSGETPFLYDIGVPWLVLPVVAAGVVLWRRGGPVGRRLLVTLSIAFLLGVAGVWRTVGIGFQYRLLWTWLPALLGGVMVLWVVWQEVARRWPWAERRLLVPGALGVLGVLMAVNTVSAVQADGVFPVDGRNLAAVDDELADELAGVDGLVYVRGQGFGGMHYARAVLLAVEKRGFDARMDRSIWFLREFPVLDRDDQPAVELVVATDREIGVLEDDPEYRKIAEAGVPHLEDRIDDSDSRVDELEAEHRAGRLSDEEYFAALGQLVPENVDMDDCGTFACQIGVFVHETDGEGRDL